MVQISIVCVPNQTPVVLITNPKPLETLHINDMKTYEKLIEELMESTPANAMNGNFSNAQVGTAGGIAGYSPVMGFGRRKKRKIREMFAGCPVFNVGSGDYAKCMHGRMKYERWNKKMDMHEMDNQEIRTYAHRNPGKPIIIKDSTYGTMSYFVPPKKEVDEATVRHNKSRKPKGKSYKTGDDSYVDTELSRILGTKKPKSESQPKYPAGDHPGLDPDLKLDHL